MVKILCVDDAPTVLKLLEFTLSEEGYSVTKASGPDEAMAKIESEGPFDLGIFDVNMPGKTGIELTKDVLRTEKGKNTKILILTTESSDAMKSAGKDAGARGWMTKPFNDEDLLMAVKKLLTI
ncbi:response regulator receiver domain protein [Leptospira inadai serovar Lyme str. 10]|uniref:Response regulator receiver domain protein n=2 Tax=Leptospira inadai serovar Lyme TaxID=293084 RepID=V6HDL4_9LEPT|nr:response regulator [Leptospira inadai]EQA37972.1 response regulator receiver domain protein [Leptospira inadai serovar Lyme str. 10]PNV74661.1 response regulator [Leptospira inadai serovar Lyme]